MTKAEELKIKMKTARAQLESSAWEYAREMAKDPTVTRIELDIISSDVDMETSDFNGWQCDWWAEETLELEGRTWDVMGGAWYGRLILTEHKETQQ